ncbi:DNA-binding LytR/AlgR family response regulator [Chryseobacterium sp. 7]|uniref:LytR/AlgR family response regulator transcription factor n=1 Tax=Chryseobacterium sp. 7 TaxID=2035214 RepID=UPI000EAFD6DA|nr:LytTR family DNA-binding domain-containing protein [Chryseobacterium sp. 7]RLJ30728.1 DNA-binding LytR/AlgR family response regulator [Chryseobacterium sp. 7]
MEELKCIIIHDNNDAHLLTTRYIEKVRIFSLVGCFYSLGDALQFIYHNNVDLIFLDAEIYTAFEIGILDLFNNITNIILVSANNENSLSDYIYEELNIFSKFYSFKTFLSAINRTVKENLQNECNNNDRLAPSQSLIIKMQGSLVRINLDEIDYIQSYGNYVKLFINNGKMLLCQITTNEIEKKVIDSQFLRVHKSYIVSLSKVEKISGGRLYINSNEIPIGRTFKRDLISYFMKREGGIN